MKKAIEIRNLTNKALKEQQEAEARLEREREEARRQWDTTKPQRIALYYDELLDKINQIAKQGKNTAQFKDISYEECVELFRKDGFKVVVDKRREEEQRCLNYEYGHWEGTGRWFDVIDIEVSW